MRDPSPRTWAWDTAVRLSVSLYRVLLLRYSRGLRARFGREMAEAFRALLEDGVDRGGAAGFASGWWRAVRDLARPLPGGPAPEDDRGGERRMGRMRRARVAGWLEDLGFAWRSLRGDPRFSGLVVGVLGLAMALNVGVFSVLRAYLLRPLPYPSAERIVEVRPVTDVSWRQVGDLFDRAVSWDLDAFTLVGGERPEMVYGAWITPDFLDVYGVRAALGRTFRPEEADAGAAPVAMISHRLWRERFGGDPAVVGRSFRAFTSDRPDHAESFLIVGVMPRDFWHVNRYTDVFAPIRVERAVYVGRLRPDVPLEVAEAGMTELARATTDGLPPDFQVRLTSLQEAYTASLRPTLTVLQAAVTLVLLIACANAVVLLLVRSARRERELGIRRALGAPAGRLVRQLGLEGLLLAGGAGMVGVAVPALLLDGTRAAVQASLGRSIPGGAEALRLDGTVLLVAMGACLALGLVLGLVPAALLVGRRTIASLWSGSGRGTTESAARRRLRSVLVAGEVALSMALLAGAALMVRSAVHLQRMDLGFDAERVTRGEVGLRRAGYPEPEQRIAFFETVTERVRSLPDVEAAALTSSAPFVGTIDPSPVEGEEAGDAARRARVTISAVGDGYFGAMAIPTLRGRDFGVGDAAGAAPVAIVSRSTAERLWPGGDALGRRVRTLPEVEPGRRLGYPEPGAWHTVVGVVDDVTRDLRVASDGQVYVPYRQQAGFWMSLLVRRRPAAGDAAVADGVERVLAGLDPDIPFSSRSELDDLVSEARAPTRFMAWLLGGFSGFASLLSLMGLYGVVAYAARQRSRDVAIRMALGADAGSVTALFLRQGLVVVLAGVALGALGGLALGRALAGDLRGVSPEDPLTHGAVAAVLVLTATAAVWAPARQASRAAPMGVLREE